MAPSPSLPDKQLPPLRDTERRVLQVLRRLGHASKAEIARIAGLTNAAVGSIVSSLEQRNLLITGKKRHEGQRGQPATMIHLNPTGAYGIGVRLERNGFQTILIDFDGTILARFNHELELPQPEKTLEMVCQDITSVLATLPEGSHAFLTGIGLARPYNLGSWLRELGLPAEGFRRWDGFPFAERLEEATGLPVLQENDGTAAAVAELYYGVGRRIDDFLYLFFGPAIGGGIVLKGDIVRGTNGNAADVGVTLTRPSELPSAVAPKGKWDILLNRASLNSLRRHLLYRRPGLEVGSRTALELAVRAGGPEIEEWLDDCVDALIPSIISAKALLDVPILVLESNIGGELVQQIGERLHQALTDNSPESRTAPELVSGSFGGDAGAVGAASLPIFYSFSPRKPIT